jgi:predicted Asp-tRNA(Asn)/Glu-tRNA(Gln) amidotransferase subunit C
MLNKEKIEQEAKEILDKFAEALSSVEKEGDEKSFVDRENFEREEGEGEECKDFKEKILNNAPEHDDDFILVEKGDWK